MLRVLISKDCCNKCPYQKNCRARKQKHAYAVMVSPKMVQRAQYLQKFSTKDYLKLARMRNAVEGVPSALHRRYRVDHSPFRGLIRTGWTYALAVGAYNIRKLIGSRRRTREKCAQNLEFARKGVQQKPVFSRIMVKKHIPGSMPGLNLPLAT